MTALQDRYRMERELGQGGMATVYLAEDGIGVLTLGGTSRIVLAAGTAGFQFVDWPDWSADGERLYFRALAPRPPLAIAPTAR